ncbi:MAG: Translation elongation factor Ts [uncultured Frankineae bacterium]|uniref:Elongation factor Ts n=1 Tax=uncultured Frankineae bacterium TaxID=437475 RepID=A0A6J4MGQ3_9ACTN|nr:MAG: Translation elongation factor Ts [uncultured Frankineae bacterium]
MASITAADIKKLREATGAGMTDCKKALVEADGDYGKAVEQLRIKGLKGVAKREGRAASNGLVIAKLDGTSKGTLLELNCETDFVAKSPKFTELAQSVVDAAFGSNDVTSLQSVSVAGRPLNEVLDDANASLGEKIEVRRVATFEGAYVASYLHRTNPDLPPQLGVLVELSGEDPEVAKDVAQHIAAFAPTYVSRHEVPEDVVGKEREIAEATAKEEGKPEAALPKIVEGRVNGFFKESVLLEQAFAKDNKKTVGKVLDEAGVQLTGFVRFKVGQA